MNHLRESYHSGRFWIWLSRAFFGGVLMFISQSAGIMFAVPFLGLGATLCVMGAWLEKDLCRTCREETDCGSDHQL
jgi:hypothetical protein